MEFNRNLWAVIEGEPFLSRVLKYREDRHAAGQAWVEWAQKNGGTGNVFGDPSLFGIEITTTKAPAGWVLVKHKRYRVYRPKKGTPSHKEFEALPKMPRYTAVFSEKDIPTTLNYHAKDGSHSGGGVIGYAWDPISIGWFGDVFVAMIPNIPGYVTKHMEQHPEDIIENGLPEWKLPVGLRQITEAEYKLMSAQHEVDQERKAAS